MGTLQKSDSNSYLLFTIDERLYSIPLNIVERIIHAVAVTSVSEHKGSISGVINMEGEIINVINLRNCLGIPERDIGISDRFIITRNDSICMALIVDDVNDIISAEPGDSMENKSIINCSELITGVIKLDIGVAPVICIDSLNISRSADCEAQS